MKKQFFCFLAHATPIYKITIHTFAKKAITCIPSHWSIKRHLKFTSWLIPNKICTTFKDNEDNLFLEDTTESAYTTSKRFSLPLFPRSLSPQNLMILFDKDFSFTLFHHHPPFSSFSIITNKQHKLCKHPLIFFYKRNPLIAHKVTRLALHSLCHITITYLYTYTYADMHEYVSSYVFIYIRDYLY